MKTYSPKPQDIERNWYVIDAQDVVLGRLATQVATILRGKHKPMWAPHMDTGDHVIVINSAGVVLTGNKAAKKFAYRHSGYPGGLTATSYDRLLATRPSSAVEKAVIGMLPKNRLGRQMARKLSVYDGAQHPHSAQKPVTLDKGAFPKWDGLPERTMKVPAEPKTAAKKQPAAKPKTTAKKATAKKTTAKPKTATTKPKTAVKPKTTAKKTTAKPKTTAKKATAKKTTAKPTTKKES